MKRVLIGALAVAVITSGVAYSMSHGDAVTTRKNAMNVSSLAMGTLVPMSKGATAFDAKVVLRALKSLNYVAVTYGDHFPEGSDQGDTTASPKIWQDMAGFKAAGAKFAADTAAAIANPPQDVAALGAALGAVGGNCKACHDNYRVKKT